MGSLDLEKTFFVVATSVFLIFHYSLLFDKGMALHLKRSESHLPTDALCQVWSKKAQ